MTNRERNRPGRSTAGLLYVLGVLLTALSGCAGLSTRYHDHPGDLSCLKVSALWESDEGERYLVGGLDCRLYPKGVRSPDSRLIETTGTERPLLFDRLEPGEYRLKIYLDDERLLSEVVELVSGKRLTARIDVRGVRRQRRFEQTLDRIGTGIGSALVEIGENLLVLLVDGIEISLEEALDDEDDDDGDRNAFGGGKKKPRPRKKKSNAFGGPIKK